jgi:hypothetical protein
MDECTGGTIYNASLNANGTQLTGYDGTISLGASGQTTNGDCSTNANTPRYNGRNGKFGSAINFDGTDDYVEVADSDNLDILDNQNMMIEFWFYRDTATADHTIIAKKNDQTTGAGYIVYLDDTNDDINFVAADGTDSFSMNSTTSFTTTGWHHVLIAYDETSDTNSTIYTDGKVDKESTSGTIANVNSLANALTLRIGEESDGTNPHDGQVDNVRLYRYALTGTALKAFAEGANNQNSAVQFALIKGSP